MECMRDDFKRGQILDGRFTTVAPLNHGSFGMVFTAKDTMSGDDVAIKCITKAGAVDETTTCPAAIATDDRSEESPIHSRLSYHPNIVNLIDCFETNAHQYMVLELCGNGDLYEAIRAGHGPLETEHVRAFMLELVDAIDHLHSSGVYHRDIKPENIFLTTSGVMKLGDFGLATTETWSTEFAVGSDRYMSPEQFDVSVYGYGYSPASADIWAIGIVLLNVLFQRNPFASPTPKDPLFADFARDRQSLFDVFPNMSNDTFSVLTHSLALDPANRSLGAVREALKAAVSFTTDDESLDEFCTEQNELVPTATAAREPLRTPSITSPNLSGDSYPWTTGLLKTPPKSNARQLSTIPDEPELFPGSVQSEWQYVDADEASLSSNIDSGLGMSYKSGKSVKSLKSAAAAEKPSVSFVGSLPISFTRPSKKSAASPYGANGSGFSKSWSDLWDEEEEMVQNGFPVTDALGLGLDLEDTATKPSTPQLGAISEDERGSSTPRPRLPPAVDTDADLADRSASPLRKLIEHDRANPPTPKQRSASILDKWSALGNFRRAKPEPVASSSSNSSSLTATPTTQQKSTLAPAPKTTPTAQKTNYYDAFASFATPFSNSARKKKSVSKLRDSSNVNQSNGGNTSTISSWRQGSPQRLRSTSMNGSRVWERKDASSSSPSPKEQSPTTPGTAPLAQQPPLLRRHSQEHAWSLDNNWRQHKPPVTPAKLPSAASVGDGTPVPEAPGTPSRIPALQAAKSLPASSLLASMRPMTSPSPSASAKLSTKRSGFFSRGNNHNNNIKNSNKAMSFLDEVEFGPEISGTGTGTGIAGGLVDDNIGDLEWVGGGWHGDDDDY